MFLGRKLETGHVLFIDIVGYSKLLITEQSDQMQKYNAAANWMIDLLKSAAAPARSNVRSAAE